jgi:hypothetical protein
MITASVCVRSQILPNAAPYSQFTAIENAEANQFVSDGLKYAQQLYGASAIPVKKVTLRYKKNDAFTAITDAKRGNFTIILSHKPDEFSFHGLLAHEIGHLLNARLIDCYAEGLSTLFSEKMLKKSGKNWAAWETYYKEGKEPFYGATYFMMKDISSTVGAANMQTFLSYAKKNETGNNMHIDINSWIKSLPASMKTRVKQIISNHRANVEAQQTGSKAKYAFVIPSK